MRRGTDRIQRGCRLVHQQDVGIDSQGARDHKALLLAARERQRAFAQTVLHLLPQRRAPQRALNDVVDVAVEPERARAERDVVEDRLRERVGPLEDEADARAHRYRVDIPPIEIDAPVTHVARNAAAGHEVVQAVQATEQRALAGAGRADERDDRAARDRERDVATAGTPL